MREREDLSIWEQQYLSSKLTGWKVVTFFLPWLSQMWCKRWWLFRWGALISGWLILLWWVVWGGAAIRWAGYIWWIINVVLTLVKFTEKAYKHDMPYFQKHLDVYAKLNGENTKTNKKDNNIYEDDDNELKYICENCWCDVSGKVKSCPNCWARFLDEDYEQPRKRTSGNRRNPQNNYNKFWFDKDGYNREWYDAYWFDREWFNRKWYNEEGFDKNGFDKDWYNYKWFDKNGFDREWYDKHWFDKNGLDRDGYDEYWDKKISRQKKNITTTKRKNKK